MFPNKKLSSKCPGLFRRLATRFWTLCLDFRKTLTCRCDKLKKAVSAPEKKAEQASRNNIKTIW
jgi:hypothetical protein